MSYSSKERDGTHWVLDPAGEEIYPAKDKAEAEMLVNMMNSAYHRGKLDSMT